MTAFDQIMRMVDQISIYYSSFFKENLVKKMQSCATL